jgi:hypothetical protein
MPSVTITATADPLRRHAVHANSTDRYTVPTIRNPSQSTAQDVEDVDADGDENARHSVR